MPKNAEHNHIDTEGLVDLMSEYALWSIYACLLTYTCNQINIAKNTYLLTAKSGYYNKRNWQKL